MNDTTIYTTLFCSMNLPVDIWFEIGLLLGRYDEYLEVTKLFPKLQTEGRLLEARIRLTKHHVKSSNYEYWELDGQCHRDGDLPAKIYTLRDGFVTKYWSKYGQVHRDGDLPAVIAFDGRQYWYKNQLLHRDVGPAILKVTGEELYFVNGIQYH